MAATGAEGSGHRRTAASGPKRTPSPARCIVGAAADEMGLIAPPVGLNVYIVRSVVPDVPLLTIYRGVLPFLLAMITALLLIIAFPQIALLIPNSMFGG